MRVGILALLLASSSARAQETPKILFDFENAADVKAWMPRKLDKTSDPAPSVERATEHVTSGKHSLKITFHGGRWPGVLTTAVPDEWDAYHTFFADVTLTRPGVVGFTIMQENSSRAAGWDGAVSRWTKTAILRPGAHTVSADLHPNSWSALRTKLENGKSLGKPVSLEIFLYSPTEGETLYVDNIRVSSLKPKPETPPVANFRVLGADLEVSGVRELAKKLAGSWRPPQERTLNEIEHDFRASFEAIRKSKPTARMAILRDGEKGFDPADPERVYEGWKDAYWSSHGPDAATEDRAVNYGKSASQEIFMRHRSPLMRVELATVPLRSEIVEAELVIVRTDAAQDKERNFNRANLWVAEACNRPWREHEVNAYEYARGKFWQAVGGMAWGGADPDFLPLYLAHGPASGKVNVWDFTHAVRYWTDGKHVNHGFMLHGDSNDWIRAHYREAVTIKDRPALMVIYVPPAK